MLWFVLEIYVTNWRDSKVVKVRPQRRLVSEKTPRQAVENDRIIKTKTNYCRPDLLFPAAQPEMRRILQPNWRGNAIWAAAQSSTKEKEGQADSIREAQKPTSPRSLLSTPRNTPTKSEDPTNLSQTAALMMDGASLSTRVDMNSSLPISNWPSQSSSWLMSKSDKPLCLKDENGRYLTILFR